MCLLVIDLWKKNVRLVENDTNGVKGRLLCVR